MKWYEVNQLLDRCSSGIHHDGHPPPPPLRYCTCRLRKNVHLGFYFADLIFVNGQSTAKTAKIGSLENFRPYGISRLCMCNIVI